MITLMKVVAVLIFASIITIAGYMLYLGSYNGVNPFQ